MRYEEYIPKEKIIDNSLKLRVFEEIDKNNYLELQKVNYPEIEGYNEEKFRNMIWKILEVTGVYEYAVEESGDFVGSIMLKDYEDDSIEIGCDIYPKYQNQGICQKCMEAVLNMLKSELPNVVVVARVEDKNDISRHIIEKKGGVFQKNETSEISDAFNLNLSQEHHVDVYRLY